MHKSIRKYLAISISLFVIFFIIWSAKWVNSYFARINYDEVMLILDAGIGGVDHGMFWSFMKKALFRAIAYAAIAAAICWFFRKQRYAAPLVYAVAGVMLCHRLAVSNLESGSLFSIRKSDFYEREYVFPADVSITFPQKRNVLIIALESIEKVYADESLFGRGGLIPDITALEKTNVSFENYNDIHGLTHTIAAITGMVSGLPLIYTGFRNTDKMLGAYGIGKIFTAHGYETYSFIPVSGKFSRKEHFLRNMGFSTIKDGERLKSMLNYDLDVSPFDGVDDMTLFKITKPEIEQIVRAGKPYLLFMETVNTHCEGYFLKSCEEMGFRQENMEDIAKCEDKIVADFVAWFRKTDPAAVVILIDDHRQHTGEIMAKIKDIPNRPLANAFINTTVFNGANMARPVSAMDFFPTIIEAAGGKIDGCRLGLGTSLSARCAKVPTLREKYGDKNLEKNIESPNNLYYKLMTGKDRK